MKITERLKIMLKSILDIKMGEVQTDKAVLVWDGEDEKLKAGMEVYIIGEDGEPAAAPDDSYKTEDGKEIVVKDGVVVEINDPEAEVADEPETNEEMAEEEPADEPADEPETTEEEAPAEEDRIAAIEAKIEEIVAGINQLVNALAAIEGRVAEVEGKLAKVEAPAADPIGEEPINESEQPKTKLSLLRRNAK